MKRLVFAYILCILSIELFSQNQLVIPLDTHGHDISGNHQTAAIYQKVPQALVFKVINSAGEPVANETIQVSVRHTPHNAVAYTLSDSVIISNAEGLAQTKFTFGNQSGEYMILATIQSSSQYNTLLYTLSAQPKQWFFLFVLGLLGGLTLFLYGINILSKGLQKSAGDKMRSIVSSLTRNNYIGLAVGTAVTAIIQSSTATSVMLVSFVNSKLMQYSQTLSILLGAAIGSTITVQLIAFKLSSYSLLFIIIGGFMTIFANKKHILYVGQAILGFGILFFGMELMSDAIAPIKQMPVFQTIFTALQHPFIGIFVGMLFTVIVQSSGASIGIIIILASQGLLSLEACLAFTLGANLGTPSTAIIASFNSSIEAKRVAYTMLFFKIVMCTLFVWLIPFVAHISDSLGASWNNPANLPRTIANAHTVFNIAVAVLVFPFLRRIEAFIVRLFPEPTVVEKEALVRYLDNSLVNNPTIALQLAKEETLRLSRKIQTNLETALVPFLQHSPHYLNNLEKQRITIKSLRNAIHTYILKINENDQTRSSVEMLFTIEHTLMELSLINDALTRTLRRSTEKWIERNYEFSEEERVAITDFHANTVQLFNQAMQVFNDFTAADALRIKKNTKQLHRQKLRLEKQVYQRLFAHERMEVNNSKTYVEIINMFKFIGEHANTIVQTKMTV
ncbi:MAG: Na/Pi cotransporter family protein [Bacteroidales bacterium]|jgi:phosphate:Na+ symporter|nr:Na/Pi cotransporter family protein [Bacteroidales bacterium]